MKKLSYSLEDKLKMFLFLDLDSVQRITIQVIKALRDIHNLGLIHCDLKPANIMFDKVEDDEVLMALIENGIEEDDIDQHLHLLQMIDFGLVQSYKNTNEKSK